MDRAIETGSGSIVPAALASKHKTYCCPRCYVRVDFRDAGNRRQAYFAHHPGEGTPECELYHEGNDQAGVNRIVIGPWNHGQWAGGSGERGAVGRRIGGAGLSEDIPQGFPGCG